MITVPRSGKGNERGKYVDTNLQCREGRWVVFLGGGVSRLERRRIVGLVEFLVIEGIKLLEIVVIGAENGQGGSMMSTMMRVYSGAGFAAVVTVVLTVSNYQ